MCQISASILSANFAYLADDVQAMLSAGVDTIHFDVMDFHYVPNLSMGPMVCQSLRDAGITAPIDVHLMVENPEKYIEPFAKAGASIVTFHPETTGNVFELLQQIQQMGMQAGLVFNPDQAVLIDAAWFDYIDIVLLMSVYPGFGGQSFIPDVLDKIRSTRDFLDQNNSRARLAIDGGVKIDNAAGIVEAGSDYLVLGSGLFKADDYVRRVQQLKQLIAGGSK